MSDVKSKTSLADNKGDQIVKIMVRVGLLLAVLVGSLLVPGRAGAVDVFTVYMATTGSDSNDGLTLGSAVVSLPRVEQVITAAAPTTDVQVRIVAGTYVAPQTLWRAFIPGRTITFMPVDYEIGEGIGGIEARPVFRGDGSSGRWLWAFPPWGTPTIDMGLRFYYLRVESYNLGGIEISGRYEDSTGFRLPTTGSNGNVIYGMYFANLGSVYAPGPYGFAAVELVNSSNNLVRNNIFRRLENTVPDGSHMHAVYLVTGSNGNVIRNNIFDRISGDPIQVRNRSSSNDLFVNTSTLAGKTGFYKEWLCDEACVAAHPTTHALECSSWGNLWHDNVNTSGYAGADLPDFVLTQGTLTWPGPAGCPAGGGVRVSSYGNT